LSDKGSHMLETLDLPSRTSPLHIQMHHISENSLLCLEFFKVREDHSITSSTLVASVGNISLKYEKAKLPHTSLDFLIGWHY